MAFVPEGRKAKSAGGAAETVACLLANGSGGITHFAIRPTTWNLRYVDQSLPLRSLPKPKALLT
jgi:hypothetical protein